MTNLIIKEDSVFKNLTNREWQIVHLLNKGFRTVQIANKLNIKPNTVSTIKKNSFIKLKINNNLSLHKLSYKEGILNLD
jgi:DNA-binding NarL/FixJ family response regulator